MSHNMRELIVEPICEACLPYICAHLDKPPKERLLVCRPLSEWTTRILNLIVEELDRIAVHGDRTRKCFTDKQELHAYDTGYFTMKEAIKAYIGGEHVKR